MINFKSGFTAGYARSSLIIIFIAWVALGFKGDQQQEYPTRFLEFNYPDGPYTVGMLEHDFGNGLFPFKRDHANISDSSYRITFTKGEKVNNTGAAVQVKIPRGEVYTLQYRIKYANDFESGLHGKQFGFDIGKGYDGGRGEQARVNGDGGSVRIQFDARGDTIFNQLYVYYCEMNGAYGNNPGGQKYKMLRGKWNRIKLTVTMQSDSLARDGNIKVWCNGIKKIDVSDLRFVRKESGRAITKLAFESFPGGAGIFPVHDDFVFVDDVKWFRSK